MSLPPLDDVKKRLHAQCILFVQARIAACEEAIKTTQLSANEETKSSAGDKYETGRSMAQLDMEKLQEQLAVAREMLSAMSKISVLQNLKGTVVRSGSLVFTNQGNYYLSVGAGKLVLEDVSYFAISPASPLGKQLKNLEEGSAFDFNSKTFRIERVL